MSAVIDIVLILIFALFVLIGYKKGFIRGIMGTVALVAAVLCSVWLCPRVTPFVEEKIIGTSVREKVQDAISSMLSGNKDVFDLFDEKPAALTEILDKFGVSLNDAEKYAKELKDETAGISAVTSKLDEAKKNAQGKISAYIAKPVSEGIAKAVTFLALLIIFFLLFSVILWIVNLICHLPVLNTANKLLGTLLGAVKGFLFVWGISAAFVHLLPYLSTVTDGKLPEGLVEGTTLLRILGSLNIFGLF